MSEEETKQAVHLIDTYKKAFCDLDERKISKLLLDKGFVTKAKRNKIHNAFVSILSILGSGIMSLFVLIGGSILMAFCLNIWGVSSEYNDAILNLTFVFLSAQIAIVTLLFSLRHGQIYEASFARVLLSQTDLRYRIGNLLFLNLIYAGWMTISFFNGWEFKTPAIMSMLCSALVILKAFIILSQRPSVTYLAYALPWSTRYKRATSNELISSFMKEIKTGKSFVNEKMMDNVNVAGIARCSIPWQAYCLLADSILRSPRKLSDEDLFAVNRILIAYPVKNRGADMAVELFFITSMTAQLLEKARQGKDMAAFSELLDSYLVMLSNLVKATAFLSSQKTPLIESVKGLEKFEIESFHLFYVLLLTTSTRSIKNSISLDSFDNTTYMYSSLLTKIVAARDKIIDFCNSEESIIQDILNLLASISDELRTGMSEMTNSLIALLFPSFSKE